MEQPPKTIAKTPRTKLAQHRTLTLAPRIMARSLSCEGEVETVVHHLRNAYPLMASLIDLHPPRTSDTYHTPFFAHPKHSLPTSRFQSWHFHLHSLRRSLRRRKRYRSRNYYDTYFLNLSTALANRCLGTKNDLTSWSREEIPDENIVRLRDCKYGWQVAFHRACHGQWDRLLVSLYVHDLLTS